MVFVNKTYASVEQMRHLMELGVNTTEASGYHCLRFGVDPLKAKNEDYHIVARFDKETIDACDIPAFTTDDLMREIYNESRVGKNIKFSRFDATLQTIYGDTVYTHSGESFVDMLYKILSNTLKDKGYAYIHIDDFTYYYDDMAQLQLDIDEAPDIDVWFRKNGICAVKVDNSDEYLNHYYLTIPIKWIKSKGYNDILKYDNGCRNNEYFLEYKEDNIGLKMIKR